MHYPYIDRIKTGKRIQELIKQSGYSVRQVQEYLHLSCPQPIYRWYKGRILPSLDHVYALSRLLEVSMEDMLIEARQGLVVLFTQVSAENAFQRRIQTYYEEVRKAS